MEKTVELSDTGCNVENSAHTPTICAERNAISTAVSEGFRSYKAVVVASNLPTFIYPCGVCRQVLVELSRECVVYATKPDRSYHRLTMGELLPFHFHLVAD